MVRKKSISRSPSTITHNSVPMQSPTHNHLPRTLLIKQLIFLHFLDSYSSLTILRFSHSLTGTVPTLSLSLSLSLCKYGFTSFYLSYFHDLFRLFHKSCTDTQQFIAIDFYFSFSFSTPEGALHQSNIGY